MPNYIFSCSNCNYSELIRLNINERNQKRFCPKCQIILNRLVGEGKNIIYKGDSWFCKRNQENKN